MCSLSGFNVTFNPTVLFTSLPSQPTSISFTHINNSQNQNLMDSKPLSPQSNSSHKPTPVRLHILPLLTSHHINLSILFDHQIQFFFLLFFSLFRCLKKQPKNKPTSFSNSYLVLDLIRVIHLLSFPLLFL